MSKLADFKAFLARNDVVGHFTQFAAFAEASNYSWWESSGGASVSLPADQARGGVVWTTAATDDQVVQAMYLSEFIDFNQVGKEVRFIVRLKVGDATQCDLYAGIFPRQTDLPSTADGLGVRKDDGDTNIDLFVRKDSANGFAANAASTLGTSYIEIAFEGRLDPVTAGQLSGTFFADGVVIGGFSGLAASNVPTDELCSFGVAHKNGEASSKTFTVEYMGAAITR